MRLGIALVTAALGAGAALAPMPAHAGDNYATMCAGGAHGECLYYPNPYGQSPPSGTPVRLSTERAYHHGGAGINAVGPVADDLCGGTVTASCPFRRGSGLNRRYRGDVIEYLAFTDIAQEILPVSGCISAGKRGLVIDLNCGKGSPWVAARHGHYVNVRASRRRAWFLYSDGKTGSRARLSARWHGGRSERWVFTPCGKSQSCY